MATPLREEVRRLVDSLSDEDLATVVRVLKGLVALGDDPIQDAVASAPLDDEPLTDEDSEALREAHGDIAAGNVHTHDEVKKRVGLL